MWFLKGLGCSRRASRQLWGILAAPRTEIVSKRSLFWSPRLFKNRCRSEQKIDLFWRPVLRSSQVPFSSEITSNLEPKMERKWGLKHLPARVTDKGRKSIENCLSEIVFLILIVVLWGFLKVILFYRWSKDHWKSVQNRSKNCQKMSENMIRNETNKKQGNKIQFCLAKCLICGSVLGPKLNQKSIKSGYRKPIEI